MEGSAARVCSSCLQRLASAACEGVKIGSVRGEVRADGRGRARERNSRVQFGHVADEMVRPETAAVNRSVEEEGD